MIATVRRLATRLLAMAAAAALVTTGSLIAPSVPAAEAAMSPSLEAKVVAYKTNALRASLGKRKLVRNSKLDAVALKWAKYLATSGTFKHNPNFSRQIPPGWHIAGENIALGYKGGRQLYTLWRNSPSHYRNMITSEYTHIGVGVYLRNGAYYGVQLFGAYRSSPSGTYKVAKPTVSPGSRKLTGTVRVGKTLRISTKANQWGPYGSKVSYQWYANGKKIKGATKSTFKIPASLGGKKLQVRITGRNPDATTKTVKSRTYTVKKLWLTTKKVTITGTKKVGKTLRAKTSAWTPKNVKYSYQWYVNSKRIKGATKSTYKVPAKYKGKKLKVVVRGTKTGYYSVTRTSAAATIR